MIGNDWDNLLKEEYKKPYFQRLAKIVKDAYREKIVYPAYNNMFNALKYTPYSKVKAVILGQDPYHGKGQAHGLSFSVLEGIPKPPSLKNIFKELYDDLNIKEPPHGNLTKWAKEGVLLLNSVLTVEAGKPTSHANIGWEIFTDHIISLINQKDTPVVFILWGTYAKQKKELITNPHHLIIESAHPSPYSANYGFLGSKPFSKTNAFLQANGLDPIDWMIK
ncbi:MAG: uracil-DNA glycosylase [Bacilli bacterium]|jgi:uracil-DNA glycosylase